AHNRLAFCTIEVTRLMPESESLPFVLAMLLCDVAIMEAGSNKKTLVGIFDKIVTRIIPTVHRPFFLYAKLADLRGKHTIRIDLVHLATEKKILSLDAESSSPPDSMENFEFTIPFPSIELPLEGPYEFQMFADGVFIGRAVMILVKLP